ncbi:outer membrane putative beta-barrel porin/alpha-amylase [Archangium gephyra]|nr:transporter [Archangium gephyra]REG29400.1 outer membrane putative beta-barrel porin/alpha-amylase [Archangium gephyra]
MNARLPTLSLAAAVFLLASPVEAKPYRAMVTRTAETTRSGNLELGLRYQGFFNLESERSLPYQQLSPSIRWGILDNLEANVYFELLGLGLPGDSDFQLAFGDIPLGLQWTFLETRPFALAAYARVTFPTGPSNQDAIPPHLSDGTWDYEGTLVGELRVSKDLRFMLNGSYLHQGTRDRGALADFDVPDAVQLGLAGTYNLDNFTLVGLEVIGRIYFEPAITPVWTNNANQVEIVPVVRREVFPGLVLEAVAGISVTPDLSNIYRFRALVGGTYEFDLASGPRLPEDDDDKDDKPTPKKKKPSTRKR